MFWDFLSCSLVLNGSKFGCRIHTKTVLTITSVGWIMQTTLTFWDIRISWAVNCEITTQVTRINVGNVRVHKLQICWSFTCAVLMVWLGLGTKSKHCCAEKRSCFSFKYLFWKRKLEMFLLICVFVDFGFIVKGPTDLLQCVDSNSSLCCIFILTLHLQRRVPFVCKKSFTDESVGLQSVFLHGVYSSCWGSVGHHRALTPCYQTPTTRGVTIHFNNDSIRIPIRGCRYDSRTISVHLERYDPIRFSDLKSIQ